MSLTFADTHNMVADLNKSDASEGFNQVIDFLNGSYIKYALTVNPTIYVNCIKQFWNTVVVKQSNDVTRLQALVDRKKVVITKVVIRDALRLNDADGVDCLPNEEIFSELARMGYEKPSTKLTFYKAFFSSQWKFLIHTILQSMSAKCTSWNEFSSAMASVVICLSTSKKFNFSKYIFESLVRNVDSSSKFYMYPRFIQLIIQNQLGDLSTHTTKYISTALTQKVFANIRRVGKDAHGLKHLCLRARDDVQDQSIPSPTPPIPPPQQPQDLPSTSQEALDAYATLTRRVEHLEHDKVAQDLEITKLKKRVKKPKKANKGRMIANLDMDKGIALMDDEGAEKKAEDAQEDKPEVQEAVEVVTTAKLITEVVIAVSESVTAASVTTAAVPAATITAAPSKDKGKGIMVEEPKVIKKKQQVEMDEELDYFKGMSYDDIRPIFEAKFKSNIEFLLKSKEQIEEEANIAIDSINETPSQKATKRRKLNEEVEDLKQHLEIVPDEDDDVYIEATPLARKVTVVDYQIIQLNNKPHYKIIRADGTHQLYVSFITLLKNIDREDLESLWSIVKERFSTSKRNNFSDDYLLTTLRAMFGRPDGQDQVWKSQRSIHGQAKVKS
nr:hypothetical protein [Tanacetum cinerariifolium]